MTRRPARRVLRTYLIAVAAVSAAVSCAAGALLGSWPWITTGALLAAGATAANLVEARIGARRDGRQVPLDGDRHTPAWRRILAALADRNTCDDEEH